MALGQEAILKIGGQPLDCQNFAWTMLTGPNPNRERFEVSQPISEILSTLQNPVDIFFDFPIGRADKLELNGVFR